MTALFESFSLTFIHDVLSLLTSTYLLFSRVGKPILDNRPDPYPEPEGCNTPPPNLKY